MLFQNLPHTPADFAELVLIDAVNLSPKTKAFLKGKAITTVKKFSTIDCALLASSTPCSHIRKQICDFFEIVERWMKKVVKQIHFSRHFPRPLKKIKGSERPILTALLLAEPLIGNRRNAAIARHIHLPRLYDEGTYYEKKTHNFSRPLRKFTCAA